jgi:mono/diheme cytochrome c family protein
MQGIRFLVGATIAAGTILPFQQTALAQDKAKIEAGEDIYNTYCSTCHGDKLVSSGQTFDLRRLTSNDRSRFQNSVLIGKNQMPPWKGALTDDEIDLIWHFIRDNAYEK